MGEEETVDLYTPAQFREHVDGYGERDPDAHPHAGIVRDEKVSRYMAVMSEFYDPAKADEPGEMPGRAEGLTEMRRLRGIAATNTARKAMQAGDTQTLKLLTGDAGQRPDISGIKAIQDVDQILESPAPVIVILGEMGSGKTDFAGLVGQRARHVLGVEKVASNIQSLKETDPWYPGANRDAAISDTGDEYVVDPDGERVEDPEHEVRDGFVPDYKTLDEWVKQDGDPLDHSQSEKLFIGDEFSSHGDGTGKSGHLTRKRMGPLVYKIRKYDGMLIYIGHDESSIHPLLWRVGVVIKKTGQKTAVVADKIKSGELREKRFEIEGIPPTDWRYRTKEASDWSWTDSDGEDDPEPDEVAYDVAVWTVRECKRNGLTDREAADFVPFGKSWVNDRWVEIRDGDHEAAMDRVEAITA